MKYNFLIRPALTVAFGFIGAFVAKSVTPPDIFRITGSYFLLIAVTAFGVLGFILPELLDFATRAGITALAKQIARYIPNKAMNAQVPSFDQFPFVGSASKKRSKYINPMVVDTSVLIDGRILDVVKTGFVFGTFLIIPAVIAELHTLSDSSDDIKRAKGRRGLDMLVTLKRERGVKVVILKVDPNADSTDAKLVKTASNTGARLVTVDFNLNKVAKVRGVSVLNINELANAVKTVVIPHEKLSVTVNTIGKEKTQGVGYLSDGTMVVVEDGAKLKGKAVEIEVLRVLQTAAGKMIFGKVK